MHEKILQKWLANYNSEVFLPQNLPLNILFLILNDESDDSSTVLIHAVSVLYRDLYQVPKDTEIKRSSDMFKSCIRKYLNFLVHEQDFRLNCLPEPRSVTISDIFHSNY